MLQSPPQLRSPASSESNLNASLRLVVLKDTPLEAEVQWGISGICFQPCNRSQRQDVTQAFIRPQLQAPPPPIQPYLLPEGMFQQKQYGPFPVGGGEKAHLQLKLLIKKSPTSNLPRMGNQEDDLPSFHTPLLCQYAKNTLQLLHPWNIRCHFLIFN